MTYFFIETAVFLIGCATMGVAVLIFHFAFGIASPASKRGTVDVDDGPECNCCAVKDTEHIRSCPRYRSGLRKLLLELEPGEVISINGILAGRHDSLPPLAEPNLRWVGNPTTHFPLDHAVATLYEAAFKPPKEDVTGSPTDTEFYVFSRPYPKEVGPSDAKPQLVPERRTAGVETSEVDASGSAPLPEVACPVAAESYHRMPHCTCEGKTFFTGAPTWVGEEPSINPDCLVHGTRQSGD